MKTILFDLDGTIIDSGPGILHCVAHAYKNLGIPVPDVAILRTFVGPPLRDSLPQIPSRQTRPRMPLLCSVPSIN